MEKEDEPKENHEKFENKQLEGHGLRATKTRNAINLTANSVVTSIRHLLIKKCLELAPKNGKEIRYLTKSFQNQTLAEIEKEMDLLFVEENAVENFNKLDAYDMQQSRNSANWRPTGVPDEDVAAHQMKVLEEHESNLKELLRKENDEVETLKIEVLKLRKSVQSLSHSFFDKRTQTSQDLNLLAKDFI